MCSDGADDDCDGLVDCADSDCATLSCGAMGETCDAMGACSCPGGTTETMCGDMTDNDCDGLIDCADTDCDGLGCGMGRVCAMDACACGSTTDVPDLMGVDEQLRRHRRRRNRRHLRGAASPRRQRRCGHHGRTGGH